MNYISTYSPSRAQELAEEIAAEEAFRIKIEAVQVTVYRSNTSKKKRFSKLSAYKDAAWKAWQLTHYPGCMCRREEPQKDAEDFFCGEHGDHWDDRADPRKVAHRRLVILRLARWLIWRDGGKIPQRLKTDIVAAKEQNLWLSSHQD